MMKIKNITGYSVNIFEINKSFFPTEEVEHYEITREDLLKSSSLRNMIRKGAFLPIDIDEKSNLEVQLKKESEQSLEIIKSEKKKEINGIVLRGQFLDYSGYAKVNRNLAKCLINNGINLSVNALDGSHPRLIGEDLALSSKFTYTSSSASDIIIDSIVPSSDVGRGKKNNILYTTVEAYTIPDSFSDIFNKYSEIWTTSEFCKTVIGSRYKGPITVVPGIVDFKTYKKEGKKIDLSKQAKSFKFISVFNWNYRKGADALIKAYCKAFNSEDDVSLILVCRKRRISGPASGVKDEIEKEISNVNMANPPHILRLTKEINEIQLAELYRSCNAFVLSTRGEGYGLPFLEAGLCGLPVIGTKVSAVQDILNEKNSMLVDIDGLRKVPDGATGCYFWDGHVMADLTSPAFISRLAEAMRSMVSDYEDNVEKNLIFRKDIDDKCSDNNVFKIIKDHLK